MEWLLLRLLGRLRKVVVVLVHGSAVLLVRVGIAALSKSPDYVKS